MLGVQAKYNQLMSALAEHASIKAAVILDSTGNARQQIGSARSLKESRSGERRNGLASGDPQEQEQANRESVYMTGAGDDFLLVIFDDSVQFDGIQTFVDSLIRDLELE